MVDLYPPWRGVDQTLPGGPCDFAPQRLRTEGTGHGGSAFSNRRLTISAAQLEDLRAQ